jgi:ubiquinone/menaquinone biosynthesis C-methylase UbiE
LFLKADWMMRLLRFFFHHFYHSLAWTYDGVAAAVSLGRWYDWVECILPDVQGPSVLELGHGTGHLQRALIAAGFHPVGLDESRQMGRLAARRLATGKQLVRGLAQALPFPGGAFDTLLATFPTDYILQPATTSEIQRVLTPGGRAVIAPAAWIAGRGLPDRLAAWLFRVTGQAPSSPIDAVRERFAEPFQRAGFDVSTEVRRAASGTVLVVIARRPRP